jgi:DNA polymerase/3'-5' exonuclease PolX
MVVERTLFAGRVEKIRENRVDQAVSRLLLTEHWEPRLDKTGRQAIGSRYKRLTVHGVAVDLFSVLPPASWGVIFAIRTGPEAFSRRLVTQRRKRGLLPDHLRVERGTIVFDEGPQSVIPGARTMADGIVVREERDVFALCGLDWIEPEERR